LPPLLLGFDLYISLLNIANIKRPPSISWVPAIHYISNSAESFFVLNEWVFLFLPKLRNFIFLLLIVINFKTYSINSVFAVCFALPRGNILETYFHECNRYFESLLENQRFASFIPLPFRQLNFIKQPFLFLDLLVLSQVCGFFFREKLSIKAKCLKRISVHIQNKIIKMSNIAVIVEREFAGLENRFPLRFKGLE